MEFKTDLLNRTEYVNTIIKEFLPEENGLETTIYKAVNYSLFAGGKRLRPIILIESFKLFYDEKDTVSRELLCTLAERYAVALEMIHTYSLVHDDLPAMDNDMYRRGKKTTHAEFGHGMGILAGDALLNMAFELLTSASKVIPEDMPDDIKLEVYKRINTAGYIMAYKAGSHGMIGGQVIDLEASGKEIDNNILMTMYKLKTSALLEAAMMVGAALAGAGAESIEKIEKIASNIGLAFQIRDDILDEISTQEELGKPVYSDMKNNKPTYTVLNGLAASREQVHFLTREALSIYDSLDYKNDFLRELMISLTDRKK